MVIKKIKDSKFLPRKSLEIYREWTSSFRLLPSFLIIGVQKGGTTSLYRYLEQHPSIVGAFAKEVHFFDNHTRDYKYGKGMAWYRSHFPFSTYKFDGKFAHQKMITGEGSPDYIFDVHAPKRIAADLPKVKLIILLRDPVDRAYSHYLHNFRAAWDPDRENLCFERAIAAERERLHGEYERLIQDDHYFSYKYMHYSYLKRGLYAEQLKVWLQLFPREQFLILKSEDFFAQPNHTFRQVLSFLQLPSWEPEEFQRFNTRNKNSEALDLRIKQELEDYFKPMNSDLYKILGCDFDW
jgi:hypothetical protein